MRFDALLLIISTEIANAMVTPIIATTNQFDLIPGWNLGVSGGIPTGQTVYTNLTALGGGLNDATNINNAIRLCPSNQVVALGAGTYFCSTSIQVSNGVVLRGAGLTTVITNTAAILMSGATTLSATSGVHSGYTIFSTNISIVPGATMPGVDDILAFTEDDDTSIWWSDGTDKHWSQMARVLSVSNTTNLVINPGLNRTLLAARNPTWRIFTGAMLRRAGLENMLVRPGSGADDAIQFLGAVDCWAHGVRVTNNTASAFFSTRSMFCELRRVEAIGSVSAGDGYGFDCSLEQASWVGTTGVWVEDSIFEGQFHSIILSGAQNFVASYNLCTNEITRSGITYGTASISWQHAAGGSLVLLEGNYGSWAYGDSIHGNSIRIINWRNRWHGAMNTNVTNPDYHSSSLWYSSNNLYCASVGNILGGPWSTNSWADYEYTHTEWNAASSVQNGSIWFLGYNGVNPIDADVGTTMVRYQNYDYRNGYTTNETSVAGNPTPAASLIYSSKPSWFGGLTFPPIDPNVTNPVVAVIPAGYRYVNGVNPPDLSPQRYGTKGGSRRGFER